MLVLNRWASRGAAVVSAVVLFGLAGVSAANAAGAPPLPGELRPAVSSHETPSGAQLSGASAPDWLSTINYWRRVAGLAAVSDQPAWDLGIQHHLTYLEDTPTSDT